MSAITILCSDAAHPVSTWLERWIAALPHDHIAHLVRSVEEVGSGDFLFLVSCSEIVRQAVRDRFRHALVIHASDLPEGRGWSPHIWSVLRGDDHLTVSLLTCRDPVDSGDVFRKEIVPLDGTELYDEINARLFDAELRLMSWALDNCDRVAAMPQSGKPSFWPRRAPVDGRIDPEARFAKVFDLLRVSDPIRYPAYYEYRGHRFRVRVDRMGPVDED